MANGTSPEANPLPEPDVADMEFFLGQVQMILPVPGFNFLQPKPAHNQAAPAADQSPRFVIRDVGTNATTVESGGEFVVLRGSTARRQGVESWTSYRALRDQLVAEGKLVDGPDPNYYVFAEDVAFASPSAGAAVVAGRNTNGRRHGKLQAAGQSYEEWREARLAEASRQAAQLT